MAMPAFEPSGRIVHGTAVPLDGPNAGQVIAHAWVEINNVVSLSQLPRARQSSTFCSARRFPDLAGRATGLR